MPQKVPSALKKSQRECGDEILIRDLSLCDMVRRVGVCLVKGRNKIYAGGRKMEGEISEKMG
jgi:hypothetical protein